MRLLLLLLLPAFALAEHSRLKLYVEDLQGRPVYGVVVTPKSGSANAPTGDDGRTTLSINRLVEAGEEIELIIPAGSKWVFLTPRTAVRYPDDPQKPVTVTVVRKGDRAMLASAEAKVTIVQSLLTLVEARFDLASRAGDEERQKLALARVAGNLGLEPAHIDEALRTWQSDDPFELGLAALYARKFAEATKHLRTSYGTAKTTYEKEIDGLAANAFYLGQALHGEGHYREALPKFQEAVELRPGRLEYVYWLGLSLSAMGRNEEAQKHLLKAVAEDKHTFGEEHPSTLTKMNDLAVALHAGGDLEAARVLHTQVLEIRRRLLGPEHIETLTSMANLARTLYRQDNLAGARRLAEQALAMRRELLGEADPDTLESMYSLALILFAQRELERARELQQQTLTQRRHILGQDHPDTSASLHHLAEIHHAQGDLAAAHTLFAAALAGRQAILGEAHPGTLATMDALAATLATQGNPTEASTQQTTPV